MIVFNARYGPAIAEKAECYFNEKDDRVIARVDWDDRLMGGVIYTAYTGASIMMHTAGFDPRWLNVDMLWAVFSYPFDMLGCSKVIIQCKSSNAHALEFVRKVGFKEETRVRDVFVDGDAVVLGMYRADCRWLKVRTRGHPMGT